MSRFSRGISHGDTRLAGRRRAAGEAADEGRPVLLEADLLAIFLRTGVKGRSALDLVRQMLKDFGGLRPLLVADQKTLCKLPGMGPAK